MNAEHPIPDCAMRDPAIDTQPLGLRLKQAREAKGLSVEDVAARLKLLQRVIVTIERDDWEPLGAGVHLRGQLGSYARLLGVPQATVDAAIVAQPNLAPPLITMSHTSRFKTALEGSARKVVYLAITAAIALPVWLATQQHLSRRDLALTSLDATPERMLAPAAGDPPVPARTPVDEPPVVASLTPRFERRAPVVANAAGPTTEARPVPADAAQLSAVTGAGLVLRMREDSWVEIFAPDGGRLEHGILPANSERHFAPNEVSRVTIGNAGAVDVLNAGAAIDLAPYRRQNIARFTIAPDGEIRPL